MKLQKSIIAVIALFIFALTTNAQMQYRKALDFNGDGKADIAVVRRSTSIQGGQINWFVQNDTSYSAVAWGNGSIFVGTSNPGDKIVPGDYDGDGKGDYAIVRKTDGYLYWWILNSSDGSYRAVQFGLDDDYAIPGDYDGDGKADIAVMRENGTGYSAFYTLQSTNSQLRALTIQHTNQQGGSDGGCYPTQGNFDGDNKADPTIFCRQSGLGYFISIRSVDGVYTKQQWGTSQDQPVFGDFDGDGRTDLAIVRGANQQLSDMPIEWWIKGSTGAVIFQQFGNTGGGSGSTSAHVPAQADYDGDGKTDIAVYDHKQGLYWIQQSLTNQVKAVNFGGISFSNGLRDTPVRLINTSFSNSQ